MFKWQRRHVNNMVENSLVQLVGNPKNYKLNIAPGQIDPYIMFKAIPTIIY